MDGTRKSKSLACALIVALTLMLNSFTACAQAKAPKQPAAKRSASGAQVKSSPAEAKAKHFVQMLAAGRFSQATADFDPTMKASVLNSQLQGIWQALIAQKGDYQGMSKPTIDKLGPHEIVYIPCTFGSKILDLKIVITGGKIAGFFIVAHLTKASYSEAPYVVTSAFADTSTKIGSGANALDATWSTPKADGPFPAVILVHGSGPQDRDESIGTNRPFRDLAHGLAANGIAVLRYEKRTKQFPSMPGIDMSKLTVKEESIDDALAAVQVARAYSKVDNQKIFVLGHSLGGMLLPRIAKGDPQIAGFICLAGNSRPLTDLLLEQMQYISSIPDANGAEVKRRLPSIREQLARIKDPALSEATPAKELMGIPASYWLDLRSYDPAQEMKSVEKPALFLQGGRDYQVTASGDFRHWQETLTSKANCVFKFYPKLSHLFTYGEAMATPAEYLEKTANVNEQVIKDIASWVTQKGSNP